VGVFKLRFDFCFVFVSELSILQMLQTSTEPSRTAIVFDQVILRLTSVLPAPPPASQRDARPPKEGLREGLREASFALDNNHRTPVPATSMWARITSTVLKERDTL
jgi:hypothetical protein